MQIDPLLRLHPLLLACLVALPIHSSAQPAAQEVLAQFRLSGHYSRGLVGFAGKTGEDEARFLALAARPDSEGIFTSVLADASSSPAARAYSACGLRLMGSNKLAASIRKASPYADQSVPTVSGDVMNAVKLGDLLRTIQNHGC